MNAPNANQLALNGKLNGGRPNRLTLKLAKHICATIAQSCHSVRTLCEQRQDWPSFGDIQMWALGSTPRYPWFVGMYKEARRIQADTLIGDSMDAQDRLMTGKIGKGELTMAQVQAHRVAMEDRRWYASKVCRQTYGDDVVSINNQQAVVVTADQIKDLRQRLTQAREPKSLGDTEPDVTPEK